MSLLSAAYWAGREAGEDPNGSFLKVAEDFALGFEGDSAGYLAVWERILAGYQDGTFYRIRQEREG